MPDLTLGLILLFRFCSVLQHAGDELTVQRRWKACLLSLPVCPAQNFLMQVDLRLQRKPKRPQDVFDLRMNVRGTHLLHLQTNMIKYSSCIFILQCVSGLFLTPSYIKSQWKKGAEAPTNTKHEHTEYGSITSFSSTY